MPIASRRRTVRSKFCSIELALVLAATPGLAQHEHPTAATPSRPPVGSGTAWLPATTPVVGWHLTTGGWRVMLHGSLFVQYIHESGPRGNWQFGSVNWAMIEAGRSLGSGTLGVRVMASAEPLTLTRGGYPQLLQVAQPYKGGIVTDRMHPHELVSEAAVTYEHAISGPLRASVYLGAVGEPALGPAAYMHRPSAMNDPTAPLGHHAQDVTHESFGVVTAGLSTRHVRLEASAFNGAHPNEVRTNFDYQGARLDAYAVRVTANPTDRLSIATSLGYLSATRGPHSHGAMRRYSLAIQHVAPRAGGAWATSVIWGANVPTDTRRARHTALVETNVDLGSRSAVFARAEYVTRSDEELELVGSVSETVSFSTVALGLGRRIGQMRGVAVWLGVRGNAYILPEELRVFYGSRTPTGLLAYLHLRPPEVP